MQRMLLVRPFVFCFFSCVILVMIAFWDRQVEIVFIWIIAIRKRVATNHLSSSDCVCDFCCFVVLARKKELFWNRKVRIIHEFRWIFRIFLCFGYFCFVCYSVLCDLFACCCNTVKISGKLKSCAASTTEQTKIGIKKSHAAICVCPVLVSNEIFVDHSSIKTSPTATEILISIKNPFESSTFN